MDGIILLLLLVPVVFFILLLILINRSAEQQKVTELLYDRIKQLSNEIAGLSKELKNQKPPVEEKKPVAEDKPVQKIAVSTPKEEIKPAISTEIKKQEPVPPVVAPKKEEPVAEKKELPTFNIPAPKPKADLEKFIGENIANKIGIAVLVLGISFFIKYAIDKNWIREGNRVIIGLICGAILIGIAHRIRKQYRAFSSVLAGGGLAVFYFSFAYAFHQYQLINQPTAFILMVLITALGVLLSLVYDRLELSILAAIGGFITPFLIRGEQDNYVALFTYLCILNAGVMTLAWFKRWPSLNTIALFFTTIIYGSWLVDRLWIDDTKKFPYKEALLFAILFYLQFIIMNIVNNIRLKKLFTAFDFLIVLGVHFLFYVAGLFILQYWNDGEYMGLFTAAIGVFDLLLAFGFRQKKSIDKNFLSLLTGLAITFISLTAPVQFRGNHITLFWAAETVLLFWLFPRTRLVQLKIASFILAVLLLLSLAGTWLQVYFISGQKISILLNKGFTTGIASAASLLIYYRLMKKEADSFYLSGITNQTIRNFLFIAFITTLYLCGALEIFYQFSSRIIVQSLFAIYIQLYSFVFAIILLLSFKKTSLYAILKIIITFFCLSLYLVNIVTNYEVSLSLIEKNENWLFLSHWIGVLLLVWLLQHLVVYFKNQADKKWLTYLPSFTWLTCSSIILIFSIEMYLANLWLNYKNQNDWPWWENLYYKAGLSILWSICSFVMMWLGMHFKLRMLRIISLTLFTITLIKLFLYDIRNMPPGGKIAAFILLGVLLLTVSFMYQRLKKIIVEDPEVTPDK
jgi:uncharacterized membrane protein